MPDWYEDMKIWDKYSSKCSWVLVLDVNPEPLEEVYEGREMTRSIYIQTNTLGQHPNLDG